MALADLEKSILTHKYKQWEIMMQGMILSFFFHPASSVDAYYFFFYMDIV